MKHTKIILAAILALTLTACSDTNTAEVSDLPDLTTTGTALTEDTRTAEETTTTAEITTVSETETETTEAETETLEEVEIDITGTHTLSVGGCNVDCTISTSNWNGDNIEFTNRQKTLINSFFINSNADELYNIISNGAEGLMAGDIPEVVNASLEDLYFFDCDGDSEEEMLAVLELYDISNGFGSSYAVCYVDNSEVSFVFDGAHMHRSVFFAAVDTQPFIAEFELAMGYTVDPVVEAEKVFTFSEDGFVPYTVPEGKSLCVRVSDDFNRLYLFNTDVNNNTEYYYMDEIATGDIEQTLGWVNGDIKVIDGFEAE